MKFLKSSFLFALLAGLLSAVQSQPLEKPTEAEPPHLSATELSDLIGGPTKVPLHFENADLNDVIKEVTAKFGVPLALSVRTGSKGPVTFDLPDATFWEVCDILRTQVQYDRNGPKVAPTRSLLLIPPVTPYITHNTPLFQVRTPGFRTSDKGWTITLYLITDPKLEIAQSSGRIRLTEVIDEQGRNLVENPTEEVRTSTLYSTVPSLYYSSLSKTGAKPEGKKIVRVRGVVSAYAVLGREPWEISLKELPQEKTIVRDGVTQTLNISAVQRDEDKERYNVELSRSYKSLINYRFWPGSETRKNYVYNYALYAGIQLLDAQGRKFFLRRMNSDANYDNEIYFYSWTGRYERTPEDKREDDILPEGEPAKLIWPLPGEIRRFEVPFELTDVPIN